LDKKTISFIGCGNMGEAILKGLIESRLIAPDKIGFFEKAEKRRDYITKKYNIASSDDVCSLVENSKYILVAVKPQNIAGLIRDMKGCYQNGRNCIISIAAGISTGYYEKSLGKGTSVIRVMPNTPAIYKKGMITVSSGNYAGEDDLAFVMQIMGKIGRCMVIDEALQHISPAINGSGPAYFFLFGKALMQAAAENGLDESTARKLVAHTMAGSAEIMARSVSGMDELISKVASPGGTTEKALTVFKDRGLESIIADGVENALKRSKEIEKDMDPPE